MLCPHQKTILKFSTLGNVIIAITFPIIRRCIIIIQKRTILYHRNNYVIMDAVVLRNLGVPVVSIRVLKILLLALLIYNNIRLE